MVQLPVGPYRTVPVAVPVVVPVAVTVVVPRWYIGQLKAKHLITVQFCSKGCLIIQLGSFEILRLTSKLPLLKTPSGHRCFSYRRARFWNNLSAEGKNAQTLNQFNAVYKISKQSFPRLHFIFHFHNFN